jgi:MoxR-like ATPase
MTQAVAVEEIAAAKERIDVLRREVMRVYIGAPRTLDLMITALLAQGHVLLEGVPGVAKTTLVKAYAAALGASVRRIQFTPDLLPADITGTYVLSPKEGTFSLRAGPVFANIVLADEINRASPKTQSALLEAMEERQVSADGASHVLPEPFMVIATQNPVEQEGTYRLPESQLDRFLMRLSLGYPDRDAELAIVQTHGTNTAIADLQAVVTTDEIMALIDAVRTVHLALTLQGYMVDLAEASRRHPALLLGLSPRATLQLSRATRARAASQGREYATPDDVKAVAEPVLSHRVMLRPDAMSRGVTGVSIIREIVNSVPVPTGR